MKLFKKSTLFSYMFLLVLFFLTEVIFRKLSNIELVPSSMLRIIISLNLVALVFGFIFSMFKRKTNNILNLALVFIGCLYGWLQIGFNIYIGVYISLNASSQLNAVTNFIGEFLSSQTLESYLMFIPFLIGIVLTVLFTKANSKSEHFSLIRKKNVEIINFLSTAICVCLFALAFIESLNPKYTADKFQAESNKNLFLTASNPSICVKEFGILSYGIIDVKSKIYTPQIEETVSLSDYTTTGSIELDSEIAYHKSIDDEAWSNVIDNENKSNINKLNNYFYNNNVTSENDYTNYFEGKNLIVMMLESVNDMIINPDYFPNFYKMYSEGWFFENNYSPRNSCATGNNEFSAVTGLYSIYNSCTMNTYIKNKYPYAIFNVFNNSGYYTNSFHNYTDSFYNRTSFHPNAGSQKFYNINKLNMKFIPGYGGWSSDVDFIRAYFEKMDKTVDYNKPFMSYLTTLTSHQPYSGDDYYNTLHLDMTKGSGLPMPIRRYFSKLKVLDDALGDLLKGLEERGILDDTVIVMFGDHYPYGLSTNNIKTVLTRDLTDFEIEKVPLVMYNPSMEAQTFSTYTTYVNLLPTLANLFGVSYDSRVYAGKDIFSSEYENYAVFANSSWKNDLVYYNSTTGAIKYYTDDKTTYNNEEIKRINADILGKVNASTNAIKTNYFDYLDKQIKVEVDKLEAERALEEVNDLEREEE